MKETDYNKLLQKALKKFKVESFYDLSSYKDPTKLVEFIRYLDDLLTSDIDDQDTPVYNKKNPDLHHTIDLSTGKLPTSITKGSKLKKIPKKLESGVVVNESILNEDKLVYGIEYKISNNNKWRPTSFKRVITDYNLKSKTTNDVQRLASELKVRGNWDDVRITLNGTPIDELNEYPYVWETKTNRYRYKIKSLVENLITIKTLNEQFLRK